MFIVGVMSGFLSNTGTAAILILVVIGIAVKSGYSRSRVLMQDQSSVFNTIISLIHVYFANINFRWVICLVVISLKHAEFVLNTTYRKNLKFNRIFL